MVAGSLEKLPIPMITNLTVARKNEIGTQPKIQMTGRSLFVFGSRLLFVLHFLGAIVRGGGDFHNAAAEQFL